MNKDRIRKDALKWRSGIDKTEYERLCKRIDESVIDYIAQHKCECIYSYCSSAFEVSTAHINQFILNNGINLALPKVTNASESKMDFYQILDLDSDVSAGYMNIYEPDDKKCRIASMYPDVIIVPGVAFDKDKNRLGYGKGFYDRYLSKIANTNCIKIALAFEGQIFDGIDCDYNDIKMDAIITESRVIV